MIRERKLIELYKFAMKYARSFRTTYLEAEDLAQEMMLAVMKSQWKSDEYATRVMRNKFFDLLRRSKFERGFSVAYDSPEVQNQYRDDESVIDMYLSTSFILDRLPTKQAKVIRHILQGKHTGVSRMTEHRYLCKVRSLVGV